VPKNILIGTAEARAVLRCFDSQDMFLTYLLAILLAAMPLLGAPVSAQPLPSPAPGGAAAVVRVTAFRFAGNTILPPNEAQALVSDGVGRDLTLAQIEALAARVTAWYRERGYLLARAYVPAQEIAGGVVEIAVSEGQIGAVEIRGARRYDPAFLRAHVLLGRDRPAFQAQDFERSLFLLNDLPGLEVKSTLKPGAIPGTTDVVLDVEKERLLTGEIEANNYGSRETGYERFGLALNVNNPFGWNDSFGIRGLLSRDGDALWYARGTYDVALGYWGTRLSLAYTHINADADVREVIGPIGVTGSGDIGSVALIHPIWRSRAWSLYVHGGFDISNLENQSETAGATATTRDRLRVLSAGATVTTVDSWRGASALSLSFYQGLGGALGGLDGDNDPEASRPGAGGSFFKLGGQVSRLQQVWGPVSIYVKAAGQVANTDLVAAEQFYIGGVGTVRGYALAQFAGDNGYAVTGEVRLAAPGFSDVPAFLGKTWGQILELYAFVDHAGAWLRQPQPDERRDQFLTSVGAGVSLNVAQNFLINVEYARPVGPRASDGRDNVVYFRAVKYFSCF
jgi:hemolysin activation/secretion protein